MSTGQAIILGIIQGLTEFLPVSSSGHLVLGQALLGIDLPGLSFEVLVHVATLLAVYAVFYRDIHRLIAAMIRLPADRMRGTPPDPYVRVALLVIVGSIPAAAVGILLTPVIGHMFSSPIVVGIALLVTGTVLLYSSRLGERGSDAESLDWRQAAVVGIAQALALVPGISRSGMTISSGLWLGLTRQEAARFSFLLAVPAIAGAAIVDTIGSGWSAELTVGPAAAGFIAAAVSGYLAIRLLIALLTQGRLHRFAYYCFVVGSVAVITSLMQGRY